MVKVSPTPSHYLERNQKILAEVTEVAKRMKLERGTVIGAGSAATTISLGHYPSAILGKELHLCLKTGRHTTGELYDYSTARELGLIRRVERELPHLLQEFPVCHGILARNRESIGVITEDFSKGGEHKVHNVTRSWMIPIRPEEIPKELGKLVERQVDSHDLATMCFVVDGKRRIGDFGEMFHLLSGQDLEKTFPFMDLFKEIRKYSVNVGYKI